MIISVLKNVVNKIGTDEAGTAGDKEFLHSASLPAEASRFSSAALVSGLPTNAAPCQPDAAEQHDARTKDH
ncbi:hypothetical protein FQZ97_1267130 [compost metagenome]